jgi:hypothetical protein
MPFIAQSLDPDETARCSRCSADAENVAEELFSFFQRQGILPGNALWLQAALSGVESDWRLIDEGSGEISC